MYQPTTTMLLFVVLLLLTTTTSVLVEAIRIGYVHTKEPLLSGALGACDASPDATACVGGIASVSAYARARVVNDEIDFAVLVPQLDVNSAFTSMHPLNKGVNMEVFSRIHYQCMMHNNTKVHLRAYITESSVMASTKTNLQPLRDLIIQPLSATIVPPPTSPWRDLVLPVMYINLANGVEASAHDLSMAFRGVSMVSVMAMLHVDDMSRVWTASTTLSPLAAGAGGLPSGYAPIGLTSAASVVAESIRTARRVAGLVVLTSDDVAVTPKELLRDMLEYEMLYLDEHQDEVTSCIVPNLLPDVFLLQRPSWGFQNMTLTTINATYTSENGTIMTAIRSIYIGAIAESTGCMTLDLNETSLMMSVGLARSTSVNPAINNVSLHEFDPKTIPNATKDALFYEDQSYLLDLSRVATSFDPVVGTTLEAMPAVVYGPTEYTCFGGECGQSSLMARALQWRFDSDIAFIDSGGVRGDGWAAGDVHMSDLFSLFPFTNNPCTGTLTGLHIFELFSFALSQSVFSTSYTATGVNLLQAAGVRIEYVLQNDFVNSIGAKILSFKVYNKTTSKYLPLDRLHYYTFASNDFLCSVQQEFSTLLNDENSYRGESVNPKASSDTLISISAEFLTANNPYTPIATNYYTPVSSAAVTYGSRSYLTFPTGEASCTVAQWYDSGVATCMDCPSGMEQSPTDITICVDTVLEASSATEEVGIAVSVTVLFVCMVVVALLCEFRRRSGSRSNGNAPKGHGADVAIIFTDIKSSTKLWGAVPMSMGAALDAHHLIIRNVIATYKGYEVKTVGDSFMIAIDEPRRAVDMAIGIQQALYEHKWPTAINAAYLHPDSAITDDPEEVGGPSIGDPWNGLRVRIGIHYGPVEVILDEVTKGYDYYGPTVNVAARVEGVTDGGQLCVSEAVSSTLPLVHPTYKITPMSKVELRGVKEEVQINCIVPTDFSTRVFDSRVGPEALIVSSNDASGSAGPAFSSDNPTAESCSSPPNGQIQTIQNTIREAFRALRGDDRIDVLERVRKAWRVQLPSNGPFKGISGGSKMSRILPGGRSTTKQEYERLSCTSHLSASVPAIKAVASCVSCEEAFDENDEDIIFRVLAQRLAPRLTGLFPPNSTNSTYRTDGSLVEMREMVASTMLDVPTSNSVSVRRTNLDMTTSSSLVRRGGGGGGDMTPNMAASFSILVRRPAGGGGSRGRGVVWEGASSSGGGIGEYSSGHSVLNFVGHQPSGALEMMAESDSELKVPQRSRAWSMYSN